MTLPRVAVAFVLLLSTAAGAGPLAIDRAVPPSAADRDERVGDPLVLPAPRSLNPWKPIFGASLGLAITATVFTVYARHRTDDEASQASTVVSFPYRPLTDDDCGTAAGDAAGPHFARACTWSRRGTIGAYSALGFGAFTFVAAYFAFRSRGDDAIVVTPTASKDGAGAELSLTW